jgi:hypothetical protein
MHKANTHYSCGFASMSACKPHGYCVSGVHKNEIFCVFNHSIKRENFLDDGRITYAREIFFAVPASARSIDKYQAFA